MKAIGATMLACVAGLLCSCTSDDTTTYSGTTRSTYDPSVPEIDRTNLATSPFGTGPITHPDHHRWEDTRVYDRTTSTSPFGTGQERDDMARTDRDATAGRTYRDITYTTTPAGWESPDVRILSILHAKNQEEIRIGRMAQEKGVSQEVRDYGAQLVRDHSANDARVVETARRAGITLIPMDEVNATLRREKGEPLHKDDTLTQLRNASGQSFDRLFADKMREGHAELVRMVENAHPTLHRTEVRELVAATLPTLHHHRQVANRLDDSPPE